MKRFVKAAAIAATACLAAFSCSKYDDTQLKESIKDLEERVQTLEEQVADNVAALQSMISLGSVQACVFDQNTGKVTITLISGKTITIDTQVKGSSLLTVIEQDGVYYWALCNDGETSLLQIGGKPVPVTVTPGLKLSDAGEWLITADGGKTWVSTGIFQQQSEETASSFFQNVTEDGDYLILTLMDGTQVKVAVVGEAKFVASAQELYFSKEGLEKSIAIEMNNVKAFTVTERPEGWKARVDHNEDEDTYSLVITSPEDIDASVTEGTVKVLGLFNGGQNPEIISVDVAYEAAFTLSLGVGATVDVSVSEHAFSDVNGYVVGAVKAAEFSAEAVAAWLNTEEGYLSECHTEAKTFSVEELVQDYDAGEAYVVFAAEHIPVKLITAGSAYYSADGIQNVEIGSTKVAAGISDIRYDSAHLSLEFTDMTGYFGGYSELGFWEAYGRDNVLEAIQVGNMTPMTAPSYDGLVNHFPDGVESTQILPDTEYVVWIMPESENGEYAAEDFILYTFRSAQISSDETIAAPAYEVTDVTYGGFTATVTPASGVYKTYAAIRKVSAVPEDVVTSVTELIDINNFSSGSSRLTVSANSFSEDDEVCLLAVSVTEDGRFGQVVKQTVELKKLEYSDAIFVSASAKIHDLGDVTLTLAFTGNPSTITYYCSATNYFSDDVMQDMLAKGQIGEAVCDYKISELEGGNTLELTGLTTGLEYTFYALVKDASGVPSKMTTLKFTPIVVIDYILSSSADYEYGMPVLSGTKSGTTYSYTITKPESCAKYWLFINDFEYITGNAKNPTVTDEYGATDKLVTMQLQSVGELELDASYSGSYSPVRSTTRVYLAWLDDKGNHHAIYTVNPNN